jgi:hypothetical protein
MTVSRLAKQATESDGEAARWRLLSRVTGIIGLASFLLTLGPIVAASGQEPGFTGDAAAVQNFFRSISDDAAAIGVYLTTIGLVGQLWFAVGLALLMARAEGPPPWRSAIAAVSALAFVVLNLNGTWQAASNRADGLTPELALFAFDAGNLAFANSWVAMGSFALCAGLVLLTGRFMRRWLGWLAVLAGVGLILSRLVWSNSVWFFPYAIFWIWLIIVSIRLLRRAP